MSAVAAYRAKDCVSLAHQFGQEYADDASSYKSWEELIEAFKPHMLEGGLIANKFSGEIKRYYVFRDESIALCDKNGMIEAHDANSARQALTH